jgi:ubiquinol-cytochrome c reductase cytochrome c1 subunit
MNIGNKFFRAAAVAGLAVLGGTTMALAAGDAERPEAQDWQFSGPFGSFDIAAIQRGLQVYLEVCSACHSLNQVAYRNLIEVGFNADEIKAIAEQYEVTDGPDDNGDMFQRAARPSDTFVAPFANANAARASNNGALPTDLSLLAKAHPRGANYIFAILTGYKDPPDDVELGDRSPWQSRCSRTRSSIATAPRQPSSRWLGTSAISCSGRPSRRWNNANGSVGKWCCSCWC